MVRRLTKETQRMKPEPITYKSRVHRLKPQHPNKYLHLCAETCRRDRKTKLKLTKNSAHHIFTNIRLTLLHYIYYLYIQEYSPFLVVQNSYSKVISFLLFFFLEFLLSQKLHILAVNRLTRHT